MLGALLSSRLSGTDLGPNAVGHLYHFLSLCGGVKPSNPHFLFLHLPQFHSETGLKVTRLVNKWKGVKYFLLLCVKSREFFFWLSENRLNFVHLIPLCF